MGFGGEVHHHIGVLFFEKMVHGGPVTDVALYKAEPGAAGDGHQVGQVRGVGELVQAENPEVPVGFHHVENKVGADKSGAAGNENGHGGLLWKMGNWGLHVLYRIRREEGREGRVAGRRVYVRGLKKLGMRN